MTMEQASGLICRWSRNSHRDRWHQTPTMSMVTREESMLDRMLARPVGRVGCFLGLFLLVVACFLLWYFKSAIVWPPLLRSLPAPPGIVQGTDHIGVGAEVEHFTRIYEVEQPYLKVAGFFKEELPKQGWHLVREETHTIPAEYYPGDVGWVDLIFQGPYILPLRIWVNVGARLEGEVQIQRTYVFIYDHEP